MKKQDTECFNRCISLVNNQQTLRGLEWGQLWWSSRSTYKEGMGEYVQDTRPAQGNLSPSLQDPTDSYSCRSTYHFTQYTIYEYHFLVDFTLSSTLVWRQQLVLQPLWLLITRSSVNSRLHSTHLVARKTPKRPLFWNGREIQNPHKYVTLTLYQIRRF